MLRVELNLHSQNSQLIAVLHTQKQQKAHIITHCIAHIIAHFITYLKYAQNERKLLMGLRPPGSVFKNLDLIQKPLQLMSNLRLATKTFKIRGNHE